MVKVQFIDGTSEIFEADDFEYMVTGQLFRITDNGYDVLFPREFIKSIRYIEV